jgi:hypothetical protein
MSEFESVQPTRFCVNPWCHRKLARLTPLELKKQAMGFKVRSTCGPCNVARRESEFAANEKKPRVPIRRAFISPGLFRAWEEFALRKKAN